MRARKELLEDVVYRVGCAAGGLPLVDGVGVFGIEEGCGGVEDRIDVTALVVYRGVGNDAAAVVFASRRGERDDIDDRQGGLRLDLAGDEVPALAVVFRAGGDSLRAVEDRAAADREDDVDIIFLAEPRAVDYRGIVPRVRLDAGELDDVEAAEQLLYLVVKPDLLYRASAVGEQDVLPETPDSVGQVFYDAFSEIEFGGGVIGEVFDHFVFLRVLFVYARLCVSAVIDICIGFRRTEQLSAANPYCDFSGAGSIGSLKLLIHAFTSLTSLLSDPIVIIQFGFYALIIHAAAEKRNPYRAIYLIETAKISPVAFATGDFLVQRVHLYPNPSLIPQARRKLLF